MIKFFSNTILSYLEKDINTFLTTTNCQVISIHYSTTLEDNELIHTVLLHYISAKELCCPSAQKMLSSDKLRRQEGKTADSIVQFPPLTIRRFTIYLFQNFLENIPYKHHSYAGVTFKFLMLNLPFSPSMYDSAKNTVKQTSLIFSKASPFLTLSRNLYLKCPPPLLTSFSSSIIFTPVSFFISN